MVNCLAPNMKSQSAHEKKPANGPLGQKAILPSEIREVVAKEDDFGHEMRVGKILRNVSPMLVEHGGTYTDPVTQKPRQFDYRCFFTLDTTLLSLAVECKNLSPSVPLVVCGTGRRENEAFHEVIESHNLYQTVRTSNPASRSHQVLGQHSLYPPGQFVGKSLIRIQADRDPMVRTADSDVYDKWAQALSSAVGLAELASGFPAGISSRKLFSVILPLVIVPDDVLWIATYDDGGIVSTDPKQVQGSELFVGRTIEVDGPRVAPSHHQFTLSHVHFLTLSGLSSFLSKVLLNEHVRRTIFPETITRSGEN